MVSSSKINIEELATFCKRKGIIFRSSEIYGGYAGFWDYGPLGCELFNNLKKDFWKFFVHQKDNIVGIEASVISHPKTWVASGHVASFSDVAVVCKKCKKATKIDKSELGKVKCDCGGEYESIGEFNLLFKTNVGALNSTESYLRGETAQGMFLNFKNVFDTARKQLPFGILQIGKCFRNEIAPRDFLFRSREFTIGEFEFFINPQEKKCSLLDEEHLGVNVNLLDANTQIQNKKTIKETTIQKMLQDKRLEEWHAYWLSEQLLWFARLGLKENVIVREHTRDELSHYSSATFDIDYQYPFGSKEIAGNANRGQFDLTQHAKISKENLEIYDEKTKQKVIPKVIEPTFGMDRVFLALLCQAYTFDEKRQNIVLKLPAFLAPYIACVFPIVNKEDMPKKALEIFNDLKRDFPVQYDDSGSIGRRYARADEIGTPLCIAIDGQTLKDQTVTLRDRDTTQQVRIPLSKLNESIRRVLLGESILTMGEKVTTRVKE